jgi:hypothetical protein
MTVTFFNAGCSGRKPWFALLRTLARRAPSKCSRAELQPALYQNQKRGGNDEDSGTKAGIKR